MKVLALLALPLGLAIMMLLMRRQPSPPAIQPIPRPYVLVAPPNVTAPIGVMAIVPNRVGTSPAAATSLAAFTRRQYSSVTSWSAMQIFVFSNLTAANRFNAYQAKRRHWPLRAADYITLKKLWPKTLAFYEYRSGREKVLYPARNPSGWWRTRPIKVL